MKEIVTWSSPRLQQEITLARWGTYGMPLLIFPTAGGDAEEIERFHIIDTLREHIDAGQVKVYSVDSVAGRTMLRGDGSPAHQMWAMDEFQHALRWEVVPAIRSDCRSDDIGIAVAGASIGALQALACICRFPSVFTQALCMSGTYDLQRFFKAAPTEHFYYASPLHWLPGCDSEELLSALRTRFVLLASGEGEAEDIGESWRVADVLGKQGVPNRVDSWGPEWKHDWPLWRNMLHTYLPRMLNDDLRETG